MTKLSIISACHNDGKYIPQLFNSLLPHIKSGVIEWLVVNDGSKEPGTLAELKKLEQKNLPNLSVIHIKNSGPAKARDTGIFAANSKIVQVIDIDDSPVLEGIFYALEIMEEQPEIDLLVGDSIIFYEEDSIEDSYWKTGPIDYEKMVIRNRWDTSNLFKKTLWEKTGGFKTKIPFPREDYLFWIKCMNATTNIHYINQPIVKYRIKLGERRNTRKRSYKEKLELYRALWPLQNNIIAKHIPEARKKSLRATIATNLGYHELQSGKYFYGLSLLKNAILFGDEKKLAVERLFKAPFKRIPYKLFGKEK